jgi:hypothetical protein
MAIFDGAFKLFGFKIQKDEEIPETPVTPINDDGAIVIDAHTDPSWT